jgi:hypothetical protein
MITIIVNDKTTLLFSSKKSLIEYCAEIRKKNKGILSNEHFCIVKKTFEMFHPNYIESNLDKAIQIEIVNRRTSVCRRKHFKFIFENDENSEHKSDEHAPSIIASLSSCFSTKENLLKKVRLDKKTCFRDAIHYQVADYKQKYFDKFADKRGFVPCEVSGLLCLTRNSEVDHIDPQTFASILNDFFQLIGIDFDDVELIDKLDGGSDFKDSSLKKCWQQYHLENAKLRVVEKQSHVAINKKTLIPKSKKVYQSFPDWFVAENDDQYLQLRNEFYSTNVDTPFRTLNDDEMLIVCYESPLDVPILLRRYITSTQNNIVDGGKTIVTASAKMFALICDVGILSSIDEEGIIE